jgi:nicotinamidase-related amidase/type 1 glutamine amidotransferase
MNYTKRFVASTALFLLALTSAPRHALPAAEDSPPLALNARSQVETAKGSGRHHSLTKKIEWAPKQTAIIVCDMWDKHWCQGASMRVAEMAPRMNEVLAAARKRGVLIIHCPSDTMDHYKDTPGRKLAQQAPKVPTKAPLEWRRLDAKREGALPIDDRDGGCDCATGSASATACRSHKAWSKQIEPLRIEPGDAITDSAEAYYLMRQRGITNVIVMGVHTNMCVLGRPFSIRQMVYQGQNVLLMRDMTDTMYNSRSAPYVSHFTGTDLVVEHIERHWCPTITSADFLGGRPFRFADDKRPRVVIVMAEDEYRTNETLPSFALARLGKEFALSYVHANEKERFDLPGIEALDEADVALFSVRRRVLPKEQMEVIRKYIASGKPVIGIRTTSHAFSLRGEKPPEGKVAWETFDPEVIGGHYTGHHGNDVKTTIVAAAGAADHPILRGIEISKLLGFGSLYRSAPLLETATPLLVGSIPGKPAEPVAWVNRRKDGGTTFYTSLGHVDDFRQPEFQQLLANAVQWIVGKNPRVAKTR